MRQMYAKLNPQVTFSKERSDKIRHAPQSSTFLPPHLHLALPLHMAGILCLLPVRTEVQQVHCRLRMDIRLGRLDYNGAISHMAHYKVECQY